MAIAAKVVEGSCRGFIWGTILSFSWRHWRKPHGKSG